MICSEKQPEMLSRRSGQQKNVGDGGNQCPGQLRKAQRIMAEQSNALRCQSVAGAGFAYSLRMDRGSIRYVRLHGRSALRFQFQALLGNWPPV